MSQGASGGHRWRTSVGTSAARGPSLTTKRRLWTTLVVLMGVVVFWLLTRFFGAGAPLKSQIVSIGMTYDNPVFRPTPFLIDSASSFGELLTRNESKGQFLPSSYPPGSDTKLDGGQQVLGILKGLSVSKNENLLVYLNLQGGLSGPPEGQADAAACFLTLRAGPDSLHDRGGGQRGLVRDLLTACGEVSAKNVVVLLEASDCGPNWRAGVLNRDFQAQLKRDVAEVVALYPNKLRVIGAVSEGEAAHSSRMFGEGIGQSAFSYFAVQGLLGAADGWRFDSDERKSSLPTARKSKVCTISFDELFAYLHEQVGAWSQSHRAAQQTVWRFPESDSPLDFAQVRFENPGARTANAAQELVETKATVGGGKNPKEQEATKSSPETSSEKSTGSKEKVVTDKSADLAAADPSQPSLNDRTQLAEAKAKSSSDKDSAASKVETAADRQSLKSKNSQDRQRFQTQLLSLWQRRDLARQAGLAARIAPREWRRLQLELLHAEKCWSDSNDFNRVVGELKKATTTFDKIDEQIRLFNAQRQRPTDELVSLAYVELSDRSAEAAKSERRTPVSNPPAELREPATPSAEQLKQFEVLLKLAFPNTDESTQPAAATKPTPPVTTAETKPATAVNEPSKHDELKKLIAEYPQFRGQVWKEAIRPFVKRAQKAKETGSVSATDFLSESPAIGLADEFTKDRSGRSNIPGEIVTILQVLAAAEASRNEQFAWTADLSRACGQVIDLRIRFERLVAQIPTESKMLRDEFAVTEDKLVAAERWAQLGQIELALQSLAQAEAALASVRKNAEILHHAAQLKAKTAAELPDFARWVARRQEASSKGSIKSARSLLRSFAEYRSEKLSEATPPNESSESQQPSKDAPPVELIDLRAFVNNQDASWFGLFDVIEDSTKLIRATAAPNTSQLNPITSLTNKLEQSMAGWRSFDIELQALLSSKTPAAEHWNRIHDVLLVPWISADQRRQLLKRLDQLDETEGTVRKEDVRAELSRGDWQAFWVIETLRLAGLDAKTEQTLWNKFATNLKTPIESVDLSETFAKSAGLGKEIAEAFANIKRKADAVATELAARKENVDPSEGEPFVRGVDPADLPAADAQAEFWFANRLSREHDEFVQNRARQMARFARLGGHPFASHWASLADRWTRLCKPTVNNLSSEMGPFAFEVIPNELLFGEAGDPAEIQFTLEVSPRAGVPFSETFVRILDANQLNVEPKKLTLTDGYELKTGGEPQKIAITLQKPKNVTLPESTITIALIDKATLMPWDVRRLTLRTPLKDQDWRIEFRAKGELADRNDPSARDRNKDDKTSDRYRTVLWLPAKPRDEKPLSLQPVLIPPPNSKTKFVSVKVFELDEKGAPRPTPSGQKDKLPLSRDGLPMELNLAAAPVAPVAPAAAATNPKPTTTPAPSPAGREVSRGWLFEILPDGEPAPVKQYVVPRVRGPNAYFNLATKIQVEFLDGVLSYKLQRRSDEEELDQALRPESVRVKLDLPPTLKVLKPEYQLGWNFRRSESNILVAQFDKNVWQKLDQTFLVSLIVNDWPRAFPFEVRHGATAVPARPRVPRIVAPADGSVFSVGKKLPIDIEIESEQLDLFGLDKPWKLTCELVPNNAQAIPPRPLVIEIFRSLHESIELVSQGETEWLLTAEVRNHRVEFDTQDLKGRFFVRVTASRLGDKVFPQGGGESEKVRIAIADPNTLPPQPKLTVTSLPKIRLGSEDDVEVPISAADSEAGIKEIAVGFANKEGKLGDNEIIKEATRSWINPLDEVERRVTLRIPAARLQDKSSGKHRLLVIAKNGVDKDCKDPLVVNLEVDQARGWVVVQVPKGCVLLFNGKEQITAGGEWRDELPIGEHEFQLVGDIVKTRKGTQKKLTVKIENTKDKPALVTLEPPAK